MAERIIRVGLEVRLYLYFHSNGSLYYHFFNPKDDKKDIRGMSEQLSAHAQGFA